MISWLAVKWWLFESHDISSWQFRKLFVDLWTMTISGWFIFQGAENSLFEIFQPSLNNHCCSLHHYIINGQTISTTFDPSFITHWWLMILIGLWKSSKRWSRGIIIMGSCLSMWPPPLISNAFYTLALRHEQVYNFEHSLSSLHVEEVRGPALKPPWCQARQINNEIAEWCSSHALLSYPEW